MHHVELAPPSSDPSKADSVEKSGPESDLAIMREFEYEAFYRHGSSLPLFDRRVHKWIPSPTGEKTLETIQLNEPQAPVPQLAHSLDRVLFKSVL
jgi:hypothetical protein